MAKFSDLIKYFQGLAETHIDILHSEQEKHFFRFEIDEVLAGINRSDVNFPMLILEGYNFGYTDNKSDNLLKNRRGAFVLLDHISDPTDHNELHDVWEELEVIGDDILLKIKADKRNPNTPAVRDFDFASAEASLIMNEVGSTAGIRYTFTISGNMPNDPDPGKWITESE